MNFTKLITGVLTIAVISLLFLAGPANAFVLEMNISDDKPEEGEVIIFNVSAEVESADAPADVGQFELLIKHENKKDEISCIFLADGTIVSGCEGMTVTPVSSPSFGYGYGIGVFSFDITLNTTGMKHGAYDTEFIVEVGDEEFEEEGDKLVISERKKENNGKGDDYTEEGEEENEREDTEGDNDEDREEKVEICHVPQGNEDNYHTIKVGASALNAHLAHGDYEGECQIPEGEGDNEDNDEEDDNENNESEVEQNNKGNGSQNGNSQSNGQNNQGQGNSQNSNGKGKNK